MPDNTKVTMHFGCYGIWEPRGSGKERPSLRGRPFNAS
jgi:hypothetical protein